MPTPCPSLPPVSVPEKVTVAILDEELPPVVIWFSLPSITESIVVVGDTVSTVQLNEVGVEPLFPTLSSDITLKVWVPSFSKFGNANGLVQVTKSELSMLHSK